MKQFLIASKLNTLIHSLSSFGLSIVYTVGHVFISWVCATLIFKVDFLLASADAIIEPIINGFWFYLLHKFAHDKLKPTALAVVYTLGHFSIASLWSYTFLDVAFNLAILDAIIEPILNGFWFFALLHSWRLQEKTNHQIVKN
tara:strand:+ start:461 stop:889 length:429 start_codon:yes stop_codon:yes gene_type:complete